MVEVIKINIILIKLILYQLNINIKMRFDLSCFENIQKPPDFQPTVGPTVTKILFENITLLYHYIINNSFYIYSLRYALHVPFFQV